MDLCGRSICSRCSTSPAGSQGGNRYKEVVTAATEHLPRKAILKKLAVLEAEIACGMKALEALLEKAE